VRGCHRFDLAGLASVALVSCRGSNSQDFGKRVFPVLLADVQVSDLPIEIRADHQAIKFPKDPFAHERLKEGLRRAGLDASSFSLPPGRRPYPGLEPLTEEDAAIFFGREAEVVRGLDRLRTLRDKGVERVLVILAASGAGKSSFLRAGLIPRLRRDNPAFITLPVVRPERSVLTGKFGLVSAWEAALNEEHVVRQSGGKNLPRSRAELADYFARTPDGMALLVRELLQACQPRPVNGETPISPTLVLTVDQGEELLDLEGNLEAKTFLSLVERTLASEKRLLLVVAARSDAFPALQRMETFARLPQETFQLPSMVEGSFHLVIEGPASVIKPRLKIDPGLVQALLEDARGQDALPLLAFTLERLYREHHLEGQLTLAHYERLGRLKGALDAAINEVFSKARERRDLPSSREALENLLRSAMIPHLCRINEADEFARRVARIDEIPPATRPLIDLLVEQRLIVRDRRKEARGEFDVIEVAHEALLREWPVLNGWLSEEREFLIWQADVERLFRRWATSRGHQRKVAFSSARVLGDSHWLHRKRADIGKEIRRFLELTKSKKRLLGTIALVAGFPFLLRASFNFLDDLLGLYGFAYAGDNSFEIRSFPTVPIIAGYSAAILAYLAVIVATFAKALRPRLQGWIGAVSIVVLSALVCVLLLRLIFLFPAAMIFLP